MTTEKKIKTTLKVSAIALFFCLFATNARAEDGKDIKPWPGGSGKFTKLVWADEFDGKGLPDKEKWGYEKGFVRNREMQY